MSVAAQQPTAPARAPQSAPAPPQTLPTYRARVLGVYDERSGDPIAGATVSDYFAGTTVQTNNDGLVALVFLPDGGSIVRIQKLGYEPQMTPVAISPSDTVPVTVLLRPLAAAGATRLPGVAVNATVETRSATLQGFQERERVHASGYFIGDTILRQSEGHRLADVLRSLPNAVMRDGLNGATYIDGSGRCSGGGSVAVYLNGVKLVGDPLPAPAPAPLPPPRKGSMTPPTPSAPTPTKLGPPNLSQIPVSDLAGVEWYPSALVAPEGFGGGCAALLLWTRQ